MECEVLHRSIKANRLHWMKVNRIWTSHLPSIRAWNLQNQKMKSKVSCRDLNASVDKKMIKDSNDKSVTDNFGMTRAFQFIKVCLINRSLKLSKTYLFDNLTFCVYSIERENDRKNGTPLNWLNRRLWLG